MGRFLLALRALSGSKRRSVPNQQPWSLPEWASCHSKPMAPSGGRGEQGAAAWGRGLESSGAASPHTRLPGCRRDGLWLKSLRPARFGHQAPLEPRSGFRQVRETFANSQPQLLPAARGVEGSQASAEGPSVPGTRLSSLPRPEGEDRTRASPPRTPRFPRPAPSASRMPQPSSGLVKALGQLHSRPARRGWTRACWLSRRESSCHSVQLNKRSATASLHPPSPFLHHRPRRAGGGGNGERLATLHFMMGKVPGL